MTHPALLLRWSVLVCFLLSSGGVRARSATPVNPGHKQKPKQIIAGLERQWRAAQLSGDAAQLEPLLSDDYVGISWTGQVNTKNQQLDRLRKRVVMVNKLDLGDLKIKLVGSVAIVTSTAEMEGTNDGAEIHGSFRYTRVYQRQPGGMWKITNFEATRVPGPGGRHGGRDRIPDQP